MPRGYSVIDQGDTEARPYFLEVTISEHAASRGGSGGKHRCGWVLLSQSVRDQSDVEARPFVLHSQRQVSELLGR